MHTVLIASTLESDREELGSLLTQTCTVLKASDILEAFSLVRGSKQGISAIIADNDFPHLASMTGPNVFEGPSVTDGIPFFLIVDDHNEAPSTERTPNALDIIVRPFSPYASRRIMNAIEMNQAQRKLRSALANERKIKEEYHHFLKRMPGGLFRYHADGGEEFSSISAGLLEMTGYETEQAFREATGNSFRGFVHPEDLEAVEESIAEQMKYGDTDVVTYRIKKKDGSVRWIEDWGRLVVDEDGVRWFYVATLDITDKITYQEELEKSNERLTILAELNNDVLFDANCRLKKTEVFGDFEKRFGRPMASSDFDKLGPQGPSCQANHGDFEIYQHACTNHAAARVDVDVALPDAQGNPLWCRYQSVVLRDENGKPYRHVGRLLDTHAMMVQQQTYRALAEHDDLTGAIARRTAIERIRKHCEQHSEAYALLFIDVDDFKEVNDRYGHPTGDRVLTHVAAFLKDVAGPSAVVARFGGDEFAVFVPHAQNTADLDRLVERIKSEAFEGFHDEAIENPFASLSLAVGVARSNCSQTCGNPVFEDLYRQADNDLYRAKRNKCSCARQD